MIHFYLKDRLINDFFYKDVFCVPIELGRQIEKDVELHFIGSDPDLDNPYSNHRNIQIIIHDNYLWMIFSFLKNIRKISLLWLFHIYKHSIIFGFLFKIFNKLWKVYIKWDFNYESLENLVALYKRFPKVISFLLRLIDIISFENKELFDFFKRNISVNEKTVLLLIKNAPYLKEETDDLFINNKKNIILMIWRIFYEKKKNYSFLLKVFKELHHKLSNWKIVFIWETSGVVDGEYNDFLLQNKVIINDLIQDWISLDFLWKITNRDVLYNYLGSSKIFCISSFNNEWDPLVQYEAMYFWNYLVSTDVWTIKGNYFPDSVAISEVWDFEAYKNNLERAIDYFELEKPEKVYKLQNQTHKFCKDNYSWATNLKELVTYL